MSAAMSEACVVDVPASSTLGRLALALRHDVFVVEQRVPADQEVDADDPGATHFVAIHDGEIAGTLRVVFRPEHAKIGRVAVRAEYRGRGIARRMMSVSMAYCRRRGANRFYLTAQVDKRAFYESLGFVAFGTPFMDAGMPHLAMKTY